MSTTKKKNALKNRFCRLIQIVVCGGGLFLLSAHWGIADYVSLNTDIYEVTVAKTGSVDINLTDYTPLFEGIQAKVCKKDEKRFRRLLFDVDKVRRIQVKNRIGQGQAILLQGRDCEWQFHTYPGQYYFTVSLVYKNSGKSPEYIAALSPFSVGADYSEPLEVDSGSENITFTCFDRNGRSIKQTCRCSENVLIVHNKSAASVMVSGFLTQHSAESRFQAGTSLDDDQLSRFKAVCTYEPPVCVLPGESIEAEYLYIALASLDDYQALDRYGAALAAINHLKPSNAFIPSGMDLDLSTSSLLQVLDILAWQKQYLFDFGWTNLTLGIEWKGDTGSEFFTGDNISLIMDTAQNANITTAIRFCPFLVKSDAPLIERKPDWFLAYERDVLYHVLNVARTDVQQWLKTLTSRITAENGFRTVILEDTDCLLHPIFPADFKWTKIQFFRQGLATVRQGLADGCNLVVLPYSPPALPYSDAMGPRATWNENWSEIYSRDAALQTQAHLYATGVSPFAGSIMLEYPTKGLDGDGETAMRNQARLVETALAGASIQLRNQPDKMRPDMWELLKCFSPPLPHAAFEIGQQQHTTASIRYLPLKTGFGEWHLIAFFNWSRLQPATLPLDLDALGLKSSFPYTLYEFFPGVYHGLLRNKTMLSVPPSAVRFFCMRPYRERPLLLSSDRHISQGALDHTSITWNKEAKILTGQFNADPIRYRMRFLTPESWKCAAASVDDKNCEVNFEPPEVISISFDVPEQKKITWCVYFE